MAARPMSLSLGAVEKGVYNVAMESVEGVKSIVVAFMEVPVIHYLFTQREGRCLVRNVALLMILLYFAYISSDQCPHSETHFEFSSNSSRIVDKIDYYNSSNKSVTQRVRGGNLSITFDTSDFLACAASHHSSSDLPTIVASCILASSGLLIVMIVANWCRASMAMDSSSMIQMDMMKKENIYEVVMVIVDIVAYACYLQLHRSLKETGPTNHDADVLFAVTLATAIVFGCATIFAAVMCGVAHRKWSQTYTNNKETYNIETSPLTLAHPAHANNFQSYVSDLIYYLMMTVAFSYLTYLMKSTVEDTNSAQIQGRGLMELVYNGVGLDITTDFDKPVVVHYAGKPTLMHRIFKHGSSMGIVLMVMMAIVVLSRIVILGIYGSAVSGAKMLEYTSSNQNLIPRMISAIESRSWIISSFIIYIINDMGPIVFLFILAQQMRAEHLLVKHVNAFVIPVLVVQLLAVAIRLTRMGAVLYPTSERISYGPSKKMS